MEKWIIPLIIVLALILTIVIIVLVIKSKLEHLTRSTLNMGLNETANMLMNGIKEEATLPKSISNMTAVYKPKIERDFPQLGYAGMQTMAENALLSVFIALEAGSVEKLTNASSKLSDYVQTRIDDYAGRETKVYIDDVKIHKSGIASYKKTDTFAEAVFEVSLEYRFYTVDGKGKITSGSKENLTQAAYQLVLTYDQELYLDTTSIVFSSNCPNCGAPVSAIGKNKQCPYCGSGLTEIADRIWLANSYKLIK